MQAARHARVIPMAIAQPFDRGIGVHDARIEEDEEVDAGRRDDPEQEPAQRPQLRERVRVRSEDRVAGALETIEAPAQIAAHACAQWGAP